MCATQARTSARSCSLGAVAGLDLRRPLEQRVHQLAEDRQQQRSLGADVVVQPAGREPGGVAQLVHARRLEAAAREQRGGGRDDLLLAAVVSLAERVGMSVACDTSVCNGRSV